MSRETLETLNTNTLIGFTDQRGHAWHYRADAQGTETNHYPDAIPVEDIQRRLFSWRPIEGTVETTVLTAEGEVRVTDPTRKTVLRSDTLDVLGVFKQGWTAHPYNEWLIRNVETITDDSELRIGSAGLLQNGGVAWVQFEASESHQAAGVEYRPFLLAATSMNGYLSSTYKLGHQFVVCDNTLDAGLAEGSPTVKIRHSVNSLGRVQEVRDALGLVVAAADNFDTELEALLAEKVPQPRFIKWAEAFAGLDKEKLTKQAATLAGKRRDQLVQLWNHDERVTPWQGTAFGVLQTVNTWRHHVQPVRGTQRAERNMSAFINGDGLKADRDALELLATV